MHVSIFCLESKISNAEIKRRIKMRKRLYKDKRNGKIFGVASGIAEYFDVDVAIVRILWLVALFCFGWGFLAYIVCALVLNDKPDGGDVAKNEERGGENDSGEQNEAAFRPESGAQKSASRAEKSGAKTFGIILLVILALPAIALIAAVVIPVFFALTLAMGALALVPFACFIPHGFRDFFDKGFCFRCGRGELMVISGCILLGIGFLVLLFWMISVIVAAFRKSGGKKD